MKAHAHSDLRILLPETLIVATASSPRPPRPAGPSRRWRIPFARIVGGCADLAADRDHARIGGWVFAGVIEQ
jgi:hypothetical protein